MAERSTDQATELGPFDRPRLYYTSTLEAEGRKFWVSREILAAYSPLFESMLYGEFAQDNQDNMKLPGEKAKDIEELLLCLIPTPELKPVQYSNVELMIRFAEEYNIKDLRKRASNALITMTKEWEKRDPRLLEILRISSAYRVDEATQAIIKRCGMEFEPEELQPTFPDLCEEVISGLMRYRALKREYVRRENVTIEAVDLVIRVERVRFAMTTYCVGQVE